MNTYYRRRNVIQKVNEIVQAIREEATKRADNAVPSSIICIKLGIAPTTMHIYRPLILDLFDDIVYRNNMFYVLSLTDKKQHKTNSSNNNNNNIISTNIISTEDDNNNSSTADE